MVLNEIYNLLENSFNNTSDLGINSLQQWKDYSKKKDFNLKLKKLSVKENLITHKNLKKSTQKELDILGQLKIKYNKTLTKYETEYKVFMEQYFASTNALSKCRAKCRNVYSNDRDKRLACIVGCDLVGPYVTKCQDTYQGLATNPSKKCGELTRGKCMNSAPYSGYITSLNSSSNKDVGGVTLIKGCCACGGGKGGKPKSELNNMMVSSCGNLFDNPSGYGLLPGGSGTSMEEQLNYQTKRTGIKHACDGAKSYFKSGVQNSSQALNIAKNLWRKYENVKRLNQELIKLAKQIFNRIKTLRSIDKTLRKDLDSEEKTLKRHMDAFEDVFSEIDKVDPTGVQKNLISQVQMEDAILKRSSSRMKYYMWSGLAIVFVLLMFKRLKKVTDSE